MNTLNFIGLIRSFRKNRYPKIEKIAGMGLLGVRIAQEYSRRIDILSEDMCYYLMEIHSSIVPTTPKHLLKMIPPKSPIFYNLEFFDNDPFDYSMNTQVYLGTLRNGQDVSIKVIDAKSKKQFLEDIYSLEKGIKLFAKFNKVLSKKYLTVDIISDIRENSLEKMDLEKEIEYTQFLANIRNEFAAKYELYNLKFPIIYKEISTADYIVGEYLSGRNVKELLAEKKMKYKNLLEIMRFHLFYIFIIGRFHSDIHAGNIIIGEKGEIYFIDCNSLTSISEDFKVNFFNFLYELCDGNYDASAKYLNKLSRTLISEKRYMIFRAKFQEIFKEADSKKLKEFNFSRKIMSLFKVAISNGMTFDKSLFPVLKALIRMEEMAYKTLPEILFIKDLKNILSDYRDKVSEERYD